MRTVAPRLLLLLGFCASCRCSPQRSFRAAQRATLGVTNVPAQPTSRGLPTVGGCTVFPADNPWNRDVSNDPVDPRSAAYIANIQSHGPQFLHPDFGSNPQYGIPYVVVPPTQARVPVRYTEYGDESDPGPHPIPLTAPIEGGRDRHVIAIQSGTCRLFELYHAEREGNGWAAGSGAAFDLNSNALRPDTWTSCDQAGLPIFPGLARFDEVSAGAIRHALRVTFVHTQDGWILPATHPGGESDLDAPPMGLRLRLKRSYDISGFRGASRVILQALRTYGMFTADTGGNWYLSGETSRSWNDADLDQLKDVPGTAFEVVATGAIRRRP